MVFQGNINLYHEQKLFKIIFRMRNGRIGSQWRHIKQTNTYNGSNLMYIDGL